MISRLKINTKDVISDTFLAGTLLMVNNLLSQKFVKLIKVIRNR